MTIFFASLAGIPPLAGWFAKFNSFKAVLDAGTTSAYVMAAIAAVNTVIAAAYYMRVLRVVWMDEVPDGDTSPVKPPAPVVAALAITVARHDRARRAAQPRSPESAPSTLSPAPSPASRSERRCCVPRFVAARRQLHARFPTPGSRLARVTEEIRRTRLRRYGAIPFERFMELALYGAEGFYTKPDGGSAGRRGDFITSPEVGPLFGAVLARYLDAEWERIGRPTCSPWSTPEPVRARWPDRCSPPRPACGEALRYVAVEVSRAAAVAAIPTASSRPSTMPSEVFDGVVIANELLDNLPFRLAVFDNGWREAFVDVGTDGRFVEVLSAPLRSGAGLPAGAGAVRCPGPADRPRRGVRRSRPADWSAPVRSSRSTTARRSPPCSPDARGATGCAPTGATSAATTISVRAGDAGHHDRRPDRPAPRARRRACPEPVPPAVGHRRPRRRGQARSGTEQAARPGLEAMKMRSRISEAEALLDPAGLGGFLVAEWRSEARPARA